MTNGVETRWSELLEYVPVTTAVVPGGSFHSAEESARANARIQKIANTKGRQKKLFIFSKFVVESLFLFLSETNLLSITDNRVRL